MFDDCTIVTWEEVLVVGRVEERWVLVDFSVLIREIDLE